ncbi:MAG: PglZ domain-containing protein [Actinobacteria bacterium]|jgi:hypothetical protein|nr:PglZ domain-containing protein [Actinomycetota bacterium]
MNPEQPVLPDWSNGCVSQIIPSILSADDEARDNCPLPSEVTDAHAVVVLVLDGLGWEQLQERRSIAPTLAALAGGPITTVAPSTTAAALTSIATGTAPGEHGIVGYRIDVDGEVINMLSWRTPQGDARQRLVPEDFQAVEPFCGQRPVVVQNAPFLKTGFTRAHLRGTRQHNWHTMATLSVEVRRALSAGEPFVYAYYDGIDKTAHMHGFGEYYAAELAACDRLVSDLMMDLPQGAALVVTADHGIVDCTLGRTELDSSLFPLIRRQSGEARFRWLHAEPGRSRELAAAAAETVGDDGWVAPIDQVIDEQWFGPIVTDVARRRLGDVAVVARRDRWFVDPAESNSFELIGRHGGLTPGEMFVPLLSFNT